MKIKTLVIEDSESDAALNIRALEKAGFEVSYQIVTTAQEMNDALERVSFDLVLSDHNLPQFNSPAALAIFVRKKLDIPFIVVSGAIGEETAVNLMKSGAHDYVMKSNLSRLGPAVERELRDAEIRRTRKQMEVQIEVLYRKEKLHRQKLQEEAEVKNLFIDVLAHELRNSVTSIVVSSDLLQESGDLQEQMRNKLIANINDSARLLTKRLDGLLDFARFSRGTFSLNRETVNLQDFVVSVASRIKPSLEKRKQELVLDIDHEKSEVNFDSSRIEQVITNLLSNASKYSPENTLITLKAGKQEKGIFFEVMDQGVGISEEDQKKLFHPYYRVRSSSRVSGTGLGLAVSHKIVEAHGGRIEIISRPGQGSTFRVILPVEARVAVKQES